MSLTLELRTGPNQRLDLSPLTPAALAGLKPKDIHALAIGTTREAVTVGDAFKLKGTDVAKLRFIGTDARCDRIGQGLTEGEEVRRVMVEVGEETWGRAWPTMYGTLGGNPWAAMPSLHFATSVSAAISVSARVKAGV